MITRPDGQDKPKDDLWAKIAAPVPPEIVQWRQQGRPKQRDGKWFAPFVAYIDAQCVRERLDLVVPGEWDLTLELLPSLVANGDGEASEEPCAFKARLQILGVIREDVGTGRDYKTASTDAFKRAAVRFGVGHQLYTEYEIVYVPVDGDSKYAKPLEDPGQAWARKQGGAKATKGTAPAPRASVVASSPAPASVQPPTPPPVAVPDYASPADEPSCPKCGGRMFDNRLSKKNPKAPDYKCRNRACDGVIWPEREPRQKAAAGMSEPAEFGHIPEMDDDVPF